MTQEINGMDSMGSTFEEETPSVAAALTVAKDVDAQKGARARRLSATLGLPENFVLENPWAAEAEKKAADIGSNKLLRDWAVQDKINAALARDDAGPLLDLANSVSAFGEDSGEFWAAGHPSASVGQPKSFEALGRAWEKGVHQVDLSDLGQRYRAGDDSVLPLIEQAQKALNPYPWQDSYGILQPGADTDFSALHYIYEADGRAVLLPNVDKAGAGLSEDEAVERFIGSGEHAGIFADKKAALSFLNLPAEKRQELYSTFQKKPAETVADKIWLTSGAEQLPRMIFRQLPEQGWTALAAGTGGALSAAALGQAGPQALLPEEVITVPAAFAVAGRAGWLAGTYTSSFKTEMGSFIADLALEKDANGQPIPRGVQNAAADVYGFLSATVERAGEAVFLKLLGPLGLGNAAEKIGAQGVKGFLRSAVRRAALDKSKSAALLSAGGRVAAGAATEGAQEGVQEGVQEALSILVEVFSKDIANAAGLDFGEQEIFTAGNAGRVKEAAKGGFQAGAWLSGAPIVAKGAMDARSAAQARHFSEKHIALHEKVEATGTKQLSPESMQRALESFDPSLGAEVEMPADAMLEYYQTGIDLAGALGITEEDLMHHAQMGHSFKVPVSRMHAYYDQRQFEAAAQIMRQTEDSFNYVEAENIDAYTEEDAELIAQYFDQGVKEYTAFELERERVRGEAIQAVQNSERLKTEAQGLAGGVEAYVDNWLGTVEGFARRMSTQGIPMEETFRRVVFGAGRNDAQSEYVSGMSEAEYAEWMGSRTERQAARDWAESDMNPVKRLRGRIDGASLKTDWPEAYREIVRNYGPGFFKSRKNGGLPVDYFVSELEEAGVVPQGTGADDIVELLKDGGRREYFQPGPEEIRLADEALAKDAAAWGKSVDALRSNSQNMRANMTMLNQTPLVLQMLGARNLPVQIGAGKLLKVMHDHGLETELLKQVPEAMTDPIMVFRSGTAGGDMVMMLELKDKDGGNIVVPIALELDSSFGYKANIATSVYGKTDERTLRPKNRWFVEQIEKGNLLYRNNKKSRDWARTSRLQLPGANSRTTTTASSGKRVYTDADLVKLREANPTLYQGGNVPLGSTRITGEAYREIVRNYGSGFFKSRKNGGLPVDYFVSELEEAGVVPQGTGADDIVELLKDGWRNEYYQDSVESEGRAASVITIDPSAIPVRLDNTRALSEWLKEQYHGKSVTIADDGTIQEFTRTGLKASTKRRGTEQRQMYAALDALLEKAVFDGFEAADARHMSLHGQNVYYSAAKIGEKLYSVRFKVDIPKNKTLPSYKDHKVTEIEIAPALYAGLNASENASGSLPVALAEANPGAISSVSIDVLKGEVKPSRIEGNTLYQTQNAPLGSTRITDEAKIIKLFDGANLSTLLHETGHVFLDEIKLAIESGAADESLQRDYGIIRNWLGAGEGAFTREQHEQFARGFEAYLMEGKAPTAELEGAFRRFKHWLTKIYQSVKNLGVTLNEDIRGVFDRMVAVEQDIAATAARNELLDLTEKELDALGLTGEARFYASKLMETAREIAADNMQQELDQNRKQRLAKYVKEATEDLAAGKIYSARSDLRKTPLDIDLVKDDYGAELARAVMRKVPGSLKTGGVDPEIFAAEHGFYSGAEMLQQIAESPSKAEAVKALAQQKEQEHDSAYEAFEYLLDTVQVERRMELVGRKLSEQLNARSIEQAAFYSVAERELMNMPMGRAMQTGNFLAAMRRELRKERRAIAAGDMAAALEANHKSRLNMEFARQSRKLAKEQGVAERRINRFVKSAKTDPDARFIVMDIGMRHGLAKFQKALAEGRDRGTITAWLKGAEADGYAIYADDNILGGPGLPWREMSTADFAALTETVNQIVTVERNRRQVATAQGKQDLEEVADSISASIYKHRSPKPQKTVESRPAAVKGLKGFHAIHTKIEALCVALDGDKLGAAWEHIYKPINDAEERQSGRFRMVRDALRASDLFGAYTRKELAGMGKKKALVPEVGEKLTHENRIAVALNMGNETNINRIREGHGWNDEQIAAVLKTLTKRDWNFVQAVWDYIDTFKDEAFALQEQITGLRPSAVEAQAFTVQTADGHILNLAGGYYPIKYNSEKNFVAYAQEVKEMAREFFSVRSPVFAMTKHGHLKERAEGGMGSPLLLELSVVTDHLFNTIHDLEYRRAVLDVAKVIRNKTVRTAIESTVGQEQYREIIFWLQDVANERQEPMHQIHRWARWARASASVMQMGFKVTTMVTQPLGFTQSAELLGYKDAAAGLKTVYGNPLRLPELLEETFARSAFMQNRIKSFDREVRDFAKQLKPGMGRFAWVEKVKDNAFVPMGIFQMSVDLPTWWGAYQKGLRENGGSEIQAAQYADSIVRQSQGSGATKDLARMFTMFYSYFNTFYNLGARSISLLKQHHGPKDIFLAANTALLLWFAPAVLSELVAGRGPDDDEEMAEWAAMNVLQYPFQAVVGVRDVTNAIFGEYGYQITPAQSAPKSLVNWFKAVNRAIEEEGAGELVKPTVEAAGYLFGLPMKQPIITVGNLWDYLTGEDPEFEVRDLFFVKPKDRR